ncbi:EAL domain-containing protein [Rosistilla oblonga]|uniref:Cyclic di-GMP phosphodiesterase Gmr n=1 Tax=Rosistilla oblonga TaxID=2527990 RepID=A0A518IPL5_9BACT|nr:EAL domain-containing protein [Rosistilla oblonga]QDV55007.1 Cyclic di-GMP phosphodiesterase Gmr [Rosistilla oblonga]
MTIVPNMIATNKPPADVGSDVWFLSGPTRPGDVSRYIPVEEEPFVVGRKPNVNLTLGYNTVSSAHASLWTEEGQLWLQDLGSTNGTFVNGQRISQPVRLGEEDLVHFAEALFRIRLQSIGASTSGTIPQNVCDQALALVQFDRLMSERLVVPHFQPIVRMSDNEMLGFEILGRGRVFGLESVGAMFEAASQLNLEVDLSQMLRWEGVRVGRSLPQCPVLFVNTHPAELANDGLETSLELLRDMAGSTRLVLEIHESAVTNPELLCQLQAKLQALGIGLAYDDFGSGQARLSELVQARPEFVKFDMSLIRDIDTASPERQRMLEALVKMVRDLDIQALAEGIESKAEAEFCMQVGFDLAQGFYYGRPVPIEAATDRSG